MPGELFHWHDVCCAECVRRVRGSDGRVEVLVGHVIREWTYDRSYDASVGNVRKGREVKFRILFWQVQTVVWCCAHEECIAKRQPLLVTAC